MELKRIKVTASDCKKTHRWAEVRSDFSLTDWRQYRIIGIGTKFVRCLGSAGTVFNVKPDDIRRVW